MKSLSAQALSGLLRTYETAIAELRALRDPTVGKLIDRMVCHRDELRAALAGVQGERST